MTSFERALQRTLGFEGGYSDVADDRGGPTNSGITQQTYSSWLRRSGFPSKSVAELTWPEVKSIYLSDFWIAAHCQELPDRLAAIVFDAAVNHGPRKAIVLLQEALDVTPTLGVYGNITKGAVQRITDETEVIRRYLDARADLYESIVEENPSQAKFAKGWGNRVAALRSEFVERNLA